MSAPIHHRQFILLWDRLAERDRIGVMPEIRTVPVESLKPAPYNPRRIDPAAMAGLEKSIERFGLV